MNVYSDMSDRLVLALRQGLTAAEYAPLQVQRGIWLPRNLPAFDRYLVWIAPPTQNPWEERRIEAGRLVTYILRADVFLLVKNYDEEQSVYGADAPNQGVFQLIQDTKAVLRSTDLGGLVERNYRETEGGSAFETGATGGFDVGGHGWVHRARLTYTAYMRPFCHP